MAEDSPKMTLIGDWSKPVNTLVEKCSDAVGGLFAPRQIRRRALAEANADEIHALSNIRITDIQRRAAQRWLAEETRKQENMEAIVQKALPDVKDDAEPQKMDDDWITNFFDKARLISEAEMQILWAKILAEEANQPQRFSKRAINLVGSVDRFDIARFARLSGFVFALMVQPPSFLIQLPRFT
jgi:hypothetical protein